MNCNECTFKELIFRGKQFYGHILHMYIVKQADALEVAFGFPLATFTTAQLPDKSNLELKGKAKQKKSRGNSKSFV
jgi:hypothetical protein